MNLKKRYSLLIITAFTVGGTANAQDKPQTPPAQQQGTLTEEIEVVRPYKPVLADAVKIRRNPDLKNEQPFKPALSYSILDKKLELNSNIKELESQKLADERPATLSNNYVKGAAGNFGTALGEVYVNTGRDEGMQAGAWAKFLTQQGNQAKQQFSNQEVGVFGRTVADAFSLSGRIVYDRHSTFFYGVNPVSSATVSMDKQRFGTISGQAELVNHYTENSSLDYRLHLNAYQFSNMYDGREGTAIISGSVNKQMSAFHAGLNASADFTAVKDVAYKMGNSFLRANPYVKLEGSGFSLKIGANIVQEFGDNSRTNIFPAVSAEIPVVEDYAIVFGGVNGDVLKTSLRDLVSENPYLQQNIDIRNSVEKLNIYAGVKGNVGAALGYKISGFYKNVDNLSFFVNDAATINRFNVIYDNGTSNIFGLDGQLSVKASDVLELSGTAQIFNYDLASEKEAWFKPELRLVSNARFKIADKVHIDGELVFQGETKAKVLSPSTPGVEQTVSVKSFLDISGGAEYRVNNKIGVFIRASNLLGTSYQKYLYYQRLGLNIMGGLNYSF